MKQIASNYAYSPATNVVTITGVNIDADQLLLIVAPGVGRTLYNFASVTGTVVAGADTRVTLNASTAGLTTTSPLVIFYDDQASAQAVTGTVALDPASLIALENITVTVGSSVALAAGSAQIGSVTASISNFPATQTVAGTVTVGNFPATQTIAGTVTANLSAQDLWLSVAPTSGVFARSAIYIEDTLDSPGAYKRVGTEYPLPVSGSVIIKDALNNEAAINEGTGAIFVEQVGSVTIGSLPAISGTVTANNPSGALTTRFGSVTTANTAQITSAVTNTSRKYLLAQNISAGTVTIGIGFSPTTTQGIQLTAGAGLTFDAFCPTGAVFWLGSVTGAAWTILEG